MGESETEDAPAALLTAAQREYLRGEKEYRPSVERDVKKRIRDRFQTLFDDIKLLLGTQTDDPPMDFGEVLSDIENGRVWPLSALLFRWCVHHPTLVDADGLDDAFSAVGRDASPQTRIDRVAGSFDRQVETGVRTALELGEFDQVPRDIDNELTISLGDPVAEMDDDDLAELPRQTLDSLFRQGDLDNEEYARVIQIKLASDDE